MKGSAMTARETAQAAVELLPILTTALINAANNEYYEHNNIDAICNGLELLRGVAAGTHVIMPKVPTERMLYKGGDHERSH